MLFTYLHDGLPYTVRLERSADGGYTAAIGERAFPVGVRALPDGGWLLELSGQQFTVYAVAQGDNRFINLDGQTYTLTVPEARAARRRGSGVGGDLTAQMPGQVVDVLVAEGEAVQAGQPLLILEAMKMEIRVAAPRAGRVKRLLVSKGALVERGQVLVEIEAVETS